MITIVEPHSDDAWLSMGQHMLDLRGRQEMTIVTVYGDRHRLAEAGRYASYIGADHIAIGIPENDRGLDQDYETELPSGILADLPGTIIGPLGLQHPEHRAVAAALAPSTLRYVELPYSRKQSTSAEVTQMLAGRPVMSWLPRSAKANAASSIFKTQARFWHFNRADMVGAVEVIVGAAVRSSGPAWSPAGQLRRHPARTGAGSGGR